MRTLLLLPLALAFPVLAEEGKENPKVVAAADRLFEFLRNAEVPKREAEDIASRYEAFRSKPKAEREKDLVELRKKPRLMGQSTPEDLKKALRTVGANMGPHVKGMMADKMMTLRLEMDDLREKSPAEYEAFLDNPSRRSERIKRCGISKEEDLRSLDPLVFPGLKGHLALKGLAAKLKAAKVDEADAAWVADQAPSVWKACQKEAEK